MQQRDRDSASPSTAEQPAGDATPSAQPAAGPSTESALALLRERRLLDRIFNTVPLMMTIYEPSTHVLRVNRMFEQLIGWSSRDLTAVSLMEQCYPDPAYREKARAYMQACRPEWQDFRVTTRDGRQVESSWTNLRLPDGTQLGIGLDITERKRAEDALRESEEALRRADGLKDEFLATLAHELRNPLAPMRNAVELMRNLGPQGADADKALSVLDRQLGIMVRLVDDLLDLSRSTMGKIDMQRQRVDLDSVVQRAAEGARPLLAGKHQLVYARSPGAPLYVDGDPIRLEQVLANLLHNAAKFTPAPGVITLRVDRDGEHAVMRVRDNGIGIRAELLPSIFDTFVQAEHGIDRTYGGLGIGLSLVRRLVELHGGAVTASSDGVGQGSEFIVRLPLAAPLEVTPAPPKDDPGGARPDKQSGVRRRRTVLVVDDNIDAADTLGRLLTSWGYDATVAYDGYRAVELTQAGAFDVIVMDVGMPGMSGYSAARLMRADPGHADALLIALTGWGEQEARRESAQAGFDHHLVKPVKAAALREILSRPLRAPRTA
jgi:PAS domain S-box-containing protein